MVMCLLFTVTPPTSWIPPTMPLPTGPVAEVKLIVLLVASGPSAVLEATCIQPAAVLTALGKVTGPVNVLLPPRIRVPVPGLYKPRLLAPGSAIVEL